MDAANHRPEAAAVDSLRPTPVPLDPTPLFEVDLCHAEMAARLCAPGLALLQVGHHHAVVPFPRGREQALDVGQIGIFREGFIGAKLQVTFEEAAAFGSSLRTA